MLAEACVGGVYGELIGKGRTGNQSDKKKEKKYCMKQISGKGTVKHDGMGCSQLAGRDVRLG